MSILSYKKGQLQFGLGGRTVALSEVAAKAGGPFYLYDLDGIRERVRALQAALPSGTRLFYAIKANSHPRILRVMREEGIGLDLVSGGEIELARRSGFSGQEMIFSGVGKTRAEIELAISEGLYQINVESPQELERIGEVAKEKRREAAVGLRLNPDVHPKTHPYITTGFRENKFGMEIEALGALKTTLKKYSGSLKLQGLSIHIGSQIRELAPFEEAVRKILPVYRALQDDGFALETLDVGGGVGIVYEEDGCADLDWVKSYGEGLAEWTRGGRCRLLCEPGRILVARSGVLVGEVQYVKETSHKNFVILNTGMHHLIRPALYQAFHRILPLKEGAAEARRKLYDVVGPICESADVLGRNRPFLEPRPGDWIAIADAGAYGREMAMTYNRQPLPEEWFWEKGKLIRADEKERSE